MSRSRGPSPFDVLKDLFPKPAAQPEQQPKPAPAERAEANAFRRTKPLTPPTAAPAPARPPLKAAQKIKQKAVGAMRRVRFGKLTPDLSSKPKAPPAPAPTGPEHLTGDAARSYVRERVQLSTLHTGQAVPETVSPETAEAVRGRVARGASILAASPLPDPLGYRVGLDFGTSTTKVVLCSDAADVDYALPTPPELQVDEEGRRQEHLWRTCVWLDDTSEAFDLLPGDGRRPILGFKTGLIQGEGHRMLASGVAHEVAAAAYLAQLIAYIVGYDAERGERAGGAARRYSRFHIGVPVASLEEDPRVCSFHRVAQAAFALAARATALTCDDVRAALAAASGDGRTTADTPYQLFEELAGVVAGYMMTPEKANGPHIIVDVGAATLDLATFFIPNGEHPLEVYETGVDLFGAQALECARHAEVPDPTFKAACQAHTRDVLSKTFRTKSHSFLPGTDGASKPMIYVGGGRLTPLHQATYDAYSKAYLAPMRSPGVGRWLERDLTTDQERLLLAWGLAQDPGAGAIPRIRPPSQVTPSLMGRSNWEANYPGSEVC